MENSTKYIAVTVHKLQLRDRREEAGDICCYLFLDTKLVEVLSVSMQENLALIPFTSLKQHLQLTFKLRSESDLIGCVSVMFESFGELEPGVYSQWITLFDDPEDDIFDGEIGEDDKEYPRALVTFQLVSDVDTFREERTERGMTSRSEVEALELKVQPEQYDKVMLPEQRRVDDISNCGYLERRGFQANNMSERPEIYERDEFLVDRSFRWDRGVEELKQCVAQRDDEIVGLQASLQNQAQDYEEQLQMLNEENLGLKSNLADQELLAEDLRERLEDMIQVESRQSENAILSNQIQEELQRYQNTVYDLEKIIEDLHAQYMKVKCQVKEEQTLKEAALIECEALRNERENVQLEKKDGHSEGVGSAETLQCHTRAMIADNLEHLYLRAELEIATDTIHELECQHIEGEEVNELLKNQEEAVQSNLREQLDSYKELLDQLQDTSQALQEENTSLKNELDNVQAEFEKAKSFAIKNMLDEYGSTISELEIQRNKLQEEINRGSLTWPQKFAFLNALRTSHRPTDRTGSSTTNSEFHIVSLQNKDTELARANSELKLQAELLYERNLSNESLREQLNDARKAAQSAEKQRELLTQELLKVNSNFMGLTNKYTELIELLANLQRSNDVTQHLTPGASIVACGGSELNGNDDEIDRKLNDALFSAGVSPCKFAKSTESVYTFENKKYNHSLEQGNLVVMDNGKAQPFTKFIRSKQAQPQHQPRRKQDNTDDKGKENESVTRNSSHSKTHKMLDRIRPSLANVTDPDRLDDHSRTVPLENILTESTQKFTAKTPLGPRKTGTIPHKSAEKKSFTATATAATSIRKTTTSNTTQPPPTNPSLFLLKPRNYRDVSPILSSTKSTM